MFKSLRLLLVVVFIAFALFISFPDSTHAANCDGLPVTGGNLTSGTYTLTDNCITTATLNVQAGETVTINGGGFAIDGNNTHRVFYVVSGGTLTLNNIIIRNGNSANDGGGIDNRGTTTLTNITLTDNSAVSEGGGIYNSGTLTITSSIISGNSTTSAFDGGGGIYNRFTGMAIITNSTIANNSAVNGGGIINDGRTSNGGGMTIINSTVSGNSATSGGGIYNSGALTLTNDTIANNSASGGGGILNWDSVVITNSILSANNSNCSNISGSFTNGGGNLINSAGGGACAGITPAVDADPMLGAFNGVYYPLLAGSPAINAAPTCAGLTDDQIGTVRPQGIACDIGAIEAELGTITIYKQVSDEIYDRAFDFTFEYDNVTIPFAISDTGIGGSDSVRVFNNLPVGVYTITEVLANLPSDWELFSTICSTEAEFPPNPANVTVVDTSGGGVVDVSLAPNQHIYCHFLNTYTPAPTPTPTSTATNTPTSTATNTPTNTATNTPTSTATNTPTSTVTLSPTNCSGLPVTGGTIPAGTYTLLDHCVTSTQLEIATNTTVTINGNGFALDGNNSRRVIYINTGGALTLNNVIIRNGNSADQGGGIFNDNGTLTITNSTISGNSASSGGGISNYFGTLTITNTIISGNSADYGGGIYNSLAEVTITNSTLFDNSVDFEGGGIINLDGPVTITNSTISGNSAIIGGGGINTLNAFMTVTNSTISDNSSSIGAGGITVPLGNILLTNSILSNNNSNCSELIADGGGNLIDTANGGACTGITPAVDADPMLGAFNGVYYPLLAGSPAIDSAPTCAGLTEDQIGTSRPQDSACDIGAIEYIVEISTATPTMTLTPTNTATNTLTNTALPTFTSSPTALPPTNTALPTFTSSPTNTPLATTTLTITPASTITSTPTALPPTNTPLATTTLTITPASTITSTPSLVPSQAFTFTPTSTPTLSNSTLPDQPTGLNNTGNMTSLPLSVTYEWNHDNKAIWYRLYAMNNSGYVLDEWYQVGVDITCTNTCTINPASVLPTNGNYQWWLIGWNTYGYGTWSLGASFTVNVPAPAQPTGLTTVGSLTQPPIAPSLQWSHDSNTQWYNIIVNQGANQVINQWVDGATCSGTCTITPTIAYQNGDYTWTVQGWSAYGAYGAVSTPSTMTITVASSLPTNLTVNINTLPAPVSTQLEWTYDGVSEWFQVWVGKIDQSHIVINSQWYSANEVNCASTCSLDVSGYLNGDYQWWISGWNAVTGTGDWVSESFTINSPVPTISNPTVNGVLNSAPVAPILTWDYDNTSEWFQVWVGGDGNTVINQWYSASDVDCVSTCSINTFPAGSVFSNGNYEWWIRGWSSVSGYGAWIMTPFTITVP